VIQRPKSKYPHVFDVYQDISGEWRWRLWAKNGKVVADSGESYKRKAAAVRACEKLQDMGGSTIFVAGVELE
jgi:uncharacterized protein